MANRQFNRFRTSTFRSRQRSRKQLDRESAHPSQSLDSDRSGDTPTRVSHQDSQAPSNSLADSQATRNPPTNRQSSKGGVGLWPLLSLMALLICGMTGLGALVLLTTVPPAPNCKELAPIASDSERLYCANVAATSGKLEDVLEAITLVEAWGGSHPLYSEGQRHLELWSKSMMAIAEMRVKDGDLQAAIRIASQVPSSSPLYAQVKDQIQAWRSDWQQGDQIYKAALAAVEARNWTKASQEAEKLSQLKDQYWSSQQFLKLTRQIAAEQLAWQQLATAKDLTQTLTPDTLKAAIDLVRTVGADSFARQEAQKFMSIWSRELLNVAQSRLEDKNLQAALETAKLVPQDTYLFAEAQDFLQLSQAIATSWQDHLMGFLEAKALANQITPQRPLYQKAQTQIAAWQSQIQDELQLQTAQGIASFGNYWMYELASAFAGQVAPNRPRRLQSQTLVASWRKQNQLIEDRPYLVLARQLAQGDTITSLQGAIAAAQKIQLKRPLRIEAQTAIAGWNQRIEVLEDQPILTEAEGVANAGNLGQAITIAKRIRPGRALYAQAQDAITQWTITLQVAEDRAILRDAAYLGSQGLFDEAIRTAARIRYGRPLYTEAQGEIGYWAEKRDALRAPPPPPEPEPQYSEPVEPEPYDPPVVNEPVPVEPTPVEPVPVEPVPVEPVPVEPVLN